MSIEVTPAPPASTPTPKGGWKKDTPQGQQPVPPTPLLPPVILPVKVKLPTGKKPASPPKETDLWFGKYRKKPAEDRIERLAAELPVIPQKFGNIKLPDGRPWGMLGNDRRGCCVFSWAAHYLMLAGALVGKTFRFDDESVLKNYEATGFDPSQDQPDGSNPTDQGTDMAWFMDWFKNVGMTDADGNVHKIDAYLRLDITNFSEIVDASYLFFMPGLGIQFPESAMDQFNNGQPWTVVPGTPKPDEGHCIGLEGADQDAEILDFNTWNANQPGTPDFLHTFLDEGYVPYIKEMVDAAGKDSEGFDWATLQADIAALPNVAPTPFPEPPPAPAPVTPPPSLFDSIKAFIISVLPFLNGNEAVQFRGMLDEMKQHGDNAAFGVHLARHIKESFAQFLRR